MSTNDQSGDLGHKVPSLRHLACSPAAYAKLGKAAAAAGVSLEQLTDLVADSGLLALPPADHLSERVSLEELGVRMWTHLSTFEAGKRAVPFRRLTPIQQSAIVVVLRQRGYAAHTIASDLGISVRRVNEEVGKYLSRLGESVVGARLDCLVGELFTSKQRLYEEATKAGDTKTAWRIEKEYVAILQDLGVIDRQAQVVDHKIGVTDDAKDAIDRIISIREKKQKRLEEIKQADATVVDETPGVDDG